jgi:hypothetical protein
MIHGARPNEGPGDRESLTTEKALDMLPEGARVHVLIAEGVLFGADWKREEVEELVREGEPEFSGERATAMGHGLCVLRAGRFHFVQTEERDG